MLGARPSSTPNLLEISWSALCIRALRLLFAPGLATLPVWSLILLKNLSVE